MEEKFEHINDDLLVKFLLNEATADEQQQVKQWLDAHESNMAYYTQLKNVWEQSLQLAAITTVDENKAWKKFQTRIHPVPVRSAKFGWIRIAATIIIIAGVGLLGFLIYGNRAKQITVVAQQTVMNDTLPDGSLITLNKGSLISYMSKFKGDTRHVVLKGEAFFNVQPNKEKPFVISTNGLQITVVGTSFNVKTIRGNTEVIVETGVVKVTKAEKTVELRANDRIIVDEKDSVLSKEKVNDRLYNYYRTKEFVCDETPLWKLVQVINEAYHSNVVIGNPALNDLRINTTFHNESLEQVLNVISMTFNIKVERQGDAIILR